MKPFNVTAIIHNTLRVLYYCGCAGLFHPVWSKKPSIGATSSKRRWIGLPKIYNFNIHFFESGQYWGHQRSSKIKCLGKCNLYNFWTKKDRDMGLAPLCFSRQDDSKHVHDDFHSQFKLDLRSRSGHDPIVAGVIVGDSHVACQTTRLDQTSRLVPLTSL